MLDDNGLPIGFPTLYKPGSAVLKILMDMVRDGAAHVTYELK